MLVTKRAFEWYESNDYENKIIVKVENSNKNFEGVEKEQHNELIETCVGKPLIKVYNHQLSSDFLTTIMLPGIDMEDGSQDYFDTDDLITLEMD